MKLMQTREFMNTPSSLYSKSIKPSFHYEIPKLKHQIE